MKDIINFLTESSNETSGIGNKIMNILDKDESDLNKIIIKRTKNWDEDKFKWSRDPMFLIASGGSKPHFENNEKIRDLYWVREKFFDVSLANVTGTLANYNVANDEGLVPVSVLGVYFDRQFFPITNLDTFEKIKSIIENK